ncbi:putative RNA recognition motif domain, nucleotide-binding alpha-beta plait domain superfamily [Helianthus annuus]|uniref:RNA recognition motif domain, nucleotide-binding alpha-beta plait domain superfamily n=1 Tax=Helianthus annuus TaxID=4232 RepID=A0A9K3DRE0_HELAN|nr:putative RNA recognition motif domain, nucleotide-binding alpha-beta plait domain superfamily [Helianthus annuus]KAJ0438120.1 putative RNA recognition motif domain, nucleotide-binding alpha-beta plait domain superfamily [Helianthus annuus]KAJ0460444.1 putative RNA recognition motif domain, nucleotide-binding alpha-beta plait domain superfamily [Helianthus annuus]
MVLTNDGGGEPDNGGPWSNVEYQKNYRGRGDGVEWTFLVQNIDDKVTRSILWRAFKPFGFVSDVYVARKRDTKGKCFGFVRYVGVVDMKETLVSMNTVNMFGLKVTVTLANYDKDHNKINYAPELLGRKEWRPKDSNQDNKGDGNGKSFGGQPPRNNRSSDQGYVPQPATQEGRSYAEALKGNSVGMCHGAKVVMMGGKGSLYPLHCIGRSILGHTKDVTSISNMKKAIEDEGLFEVGMSFVGGVTFILTFRDKATAISGMELHFEFFNSVFSKFHLWNGEDIPYSRLVSLNITGVSFIIRDNSLFDNIGGLFGDVVQKSSFSWQEEDNSSSSVKIITSQPSRIDETMVIKWNNKSIVCWVLESVGQWFPDIDEVSLQGSQDSESETCSESNMGSEDLEDFEEGEIRDNDARRQEDDRKNFRPDSDPRGNGQSLDHQGSPGVQEVPLVNVDGNCDSMHGELFEEELGSGNNETLVGDLEFSKKVQ